MKNKIIKIGISGKIGSGKSVVLNYLKSINIPCYNLDLESRKIMKPGMVCYEKIVNTFDKEVLNKNKTLNRKKIAEIVFNDKRKRDKLNSIVHPELLKRVKALTVKNIQKKKEFIVFEGALIKKTTKIGKFLDKIILIKAFQKIIIQRVLTRDSKTKEEIQKILLAQKGIIQNKHDFDYIVSNNSEISDLIGKLNSILEKISH
jgi:dephospho-CoA kinase